MKEQIDCLISTVRAVRAVRAVRTVRRATPRRRQAQTKAIREDVACGFPAGFIVRFAACNARENSPKGIAGATPSLPESSILEALQSLIRQNKVLSADSSPRFAY